MTKSFRKHIISLELKTAKLALVTFTKLKWQKQSTTKQDSPELDRIVQEIWGL